VPQITPDIFHKKAKSDHTDNSELNFKV